MKRTTVRPGNCVSEELKKFGTIMSPLFCLVRGFWKGGDIIFLIFLCLEGREELIYFLPLIL
jgi:hypothetical protein